MAEIEIYFVDGARSPDAPWAMRDRRQQAPRAGEFVEFDDGLARVVKVVWREDGKHRDTPQRVDVYIEWEDGGE